MRKKSRTTDVEKKSVDSLAKDAGAAALSALMPRLLKLKPAQIGQPRADAAAAATVALGVAQRLRDKAVRQRFLSLPAEAFSPQHLSDLEPAARAVLVAQSRAASAAAARTQAKLPFELAQRAAALRERMLKLCDYYFFDDELLAKELRDIRQGTGYLDLASDLHRLAQIYQAQKAIVQKDARHYVAGDGTLAERLADQIEAALGESPRGPAKRAKLPDTELLWRTWAFLNQVYSEIAAAGRFLWRHQDGEAMFPSLVSASRRPPRKRQPAPAPLPSPEPVRP